ncbi:MAG: carbohydrate kinase family protein [Candidatus Nezhaarchaeota archaeon]|nr:carbohydrate kinase family protein [Candidatus Nezhaarchaeota archaeon]
MLDVVGFGSLCIDFTFLVEKLPRKGFSSLAIASSIGCGGIIGNFLVGCSRLGLKCGVIGIIGEDSCGRMLLDCLTKAGIDTSMLIIDTSGPTAKVICMVDKSGERTFIVDPGVQARARVLTGVEDYVSRCRAFHTDCLEVNLAIKLLKAARSNGAITSIDVSALVEHALHGVNERWICDVLRSCDVAFIAEANAKKLFPGLRPIEVLNSMLQHGVKIAVLTLGERGCIVAEGDKLMRVKAFEVDVVDTTGAGDSFEAGFISSLLRGFSSKDAAIVGCAVAALKCTKLGAQAGLPTLKDLINFLAERGFERIASLLTSFL